MSEDNDTHLYLTLYQVFKGMWYSKKIESSWEQFSPVSKCLCQKYIEFCFQKMGNVREDKNGRRWTTFGFNNENRNFRYILLKLRFISFSDQK